MYQAEGGNGGNNWDNCSSISNKIYLKKWLSLSYKEEGHLESHLSRIDINCKFLQNRIWTQLFSVSVCVSLCMYVLNVR